MLRYVASLAVIAILGGCASSSATPSAPSDIAQSHGTDVASATCCNLFWNKQRLKLRYGAKPKKAELTYWATNGYFFYPVDCSHGSQISVTPGRTWGNPRTYQHVIVKFAAESARSDRCSLTAVLNTGSPPLAVIELDVR